MSDDISLLAKNLMESILGVAVYGMCVEKVLVEGDPLFETDDHEELSPRAVLVDSHLIIRLEKAINEVNLPELAQKSKDLVELYEKLGVTNLKDALAAITGLKERVNFTKDYESLKYQLFTQSATSI